MLTDEEKLQLQSMRHLLYVMSQVLVTNWNEKNADIRKVMDGLLTVACQKYIESCLDIT